MNEPLSVLIVEDDPHVLLGCQQALALEDIASVGVGSAEEALQLVRPPAHELFRHGAADPSLTVPLPILGSQS